MNLDKYLPVLAGLSFSIIFGFSFMFTKNGLDIISPFHLLAYRFTVAALALTILWIIGVVKLNYRGKKIKLLLLLALVQPVLYFICETQGINRTTSSEAGLMISLIPVAVTILATIFLGEKPEKKQLFFIILSVVGVIFIIIMKDQTAVKGNFIGMLFLGGAVLMAGIYNILSRKLSISYSPLEITFVMLWSGAIMFNIMAIIAHDGNIKAYFLPLNNSKVLISILYLGILSSVIAFFTMNYTLSRIKAFESAVFANLVTVISIIAGVVFRNETFYWFQIIGGIMIIIGVWGTNYYGQLEQKAEELPS